MLELLVRERVVHLGQIDLGGLDASLGERFLCCDVGVPSAIPVARLE